MKATKKIVGAACALVAAVALSAGSTFAWFSANSQVNVTGMEVKAVVPDALFIKEGVVNNVQDITKTGLVYGTNAETGQIAPPTGTNSLNPARLYNGASGTVTTPTLALERGTISKVTVQDAIDFEETDKPSGNDSGTVKTIAELGEINLTTAGVSDTKTAESDDLKDPKNYAAVYTMTIARINSNVDADLNAVVTIDYSASATGNTDQTYKFIRTAFYTVDGWVSIANVIPESNSENDPVYQNTTNHTLVFTYKDANAIIDGNFDGNTAYVVQFIVWYDGDDAECFANNALTTNGLKVSIQYTSTAGVLPTT